MGAVADTKAGGGERLVSCRVAEEGLIGALLCEDGKRYRAEGGTAEGEGHLSAGRRIVCAVCACLCVMLAALAAGLTLGLTSLDEFGLKVLCNRDPDSEAAADGDGRTVHAKLAARDKLVRDQQCARRILPLLSGRFFGDSVRCSKLNPTNSHVLLVTMLLLNSLANEALPLFLDQLVPAWAAIVVSVTVVLIFGEILPSAFFTGPHQLELAAKLSPLVAFIRLALLPVGGPMGLLLDVVVGGHEAGAEEDRRNEMKAMAKTLQQQGLERDEVNMITGVLEMHSKTAKDISMPLEKAKMLANDDELTEELVQQLLKWGHSRVFVYRRDASDPDRRDDIIGVLLVKKLVGLDLTEGRRVDSIQDAVKRPVLLSPDDNLLSVLDKFQAGMCHLAVVGARPPAASQEGDVLDLPVGEGAPVPSTLAMFCSLEDVIEALLKEDIFDEEDLDHGRIPMMTPSVLTPSLLRSGSANRSWCRRPSSFSDPGVSLRAPTWSASAAGDLAAMMSKVRVSAAPSSGAETRQEDAMRVSAAKSAGAVTGPEDAV